MYPNEIERPKITLRYDDINKVVGKKIDKQMVSSILLSLGVELSSSKSVDEHLTASVPLFKTDVTRPIDLIEEILRIYGYNNVEIPDTMRYNINVQAEPDFRPVQKKVSTYLADNGFFEVHTVSLSIK